VTSRYKATWLVVILAIAVEARAETELVVLTSKASKNWAQVVTADTGTLRRLYLGKRTRLDSRVRCIEFPPGSEFHEVFRRRVLRMDQDELARYWIEEALKGGAVPPPEVESLEDLYSRLRQSEFVLGYALLDRSLEAVPEDISARPIIGGSR